MSVVNASRARTLCRYIGGRICRFLRFAPRSQRYLLLGAALGLAAPVGLLIIRASVAGQLPNGSWVLADIARIPIAYTYVALWNGIVLSVLGYLIGRSFDRVRLESITDPLTGLFNRRYFRVCMVKEMLRGRRHGYPTSVLSIDLDHLKTINDRHGHKAGDEAIVILSESLSKQMRGNDVVARVGGDEFAVLLPQTTAVEAAAVAARIPDAIRAQHAAWGERPTISVGVAELSGMMNAASDDVLVAADGALYQAKAAGGGHSVVSQLEATASGGRFFTFTRPAKLIENGV